jgi:hypothetical protein
MITPRREIRYFEMPLEIDDEGEQLFYVEYLVSKHVPAKLFGDNAHPEEPSEIEIALIQDSEGSDVTGDSEKILQCAKEHAQEHYTESMEGYL